MDLSMIGHYLSSNNEICYGTKIQHFHQLNTPRSERILKTPTFFLPPLILFSSSKPEPKKVYQNPAFWSRSFAPYASNFFLKVTLASNCKLLVMLSNHRRR